MLARAQTDDHWNLQRIEFEDPEFDPFYLHTVFRQGQTVGTVTSGSYGYRLQKAIALAYFRTSIADDDELEVEILGRLAPE